MTNITILESKIQLHEEDILQLESQLGLSLPSDYRTFLLHHNGGHPEPNAFRSKTILPGGEYDILAWFFCLQDGDMNDIRTVHNIFQGRIPPNLLPIAEDPFGNLICLSSSGRDEGKILFWDHEQEIPEGLIPDYRNIYLIADSFDELVNGLISLPEDQ